MKLDWYTKVILTVIAIALTFIAVRPLLPQKAVAAPQVEVWLANPEVTVMNADEIGYWVDYYSE